MKYVQINSVPNGSTGSVMKQVEAERLAQGDECWRMWGRGRDAENDHEYNFGNKAEFYLDVLQTRIDGRAGFHSKGATRRLLTRLDEINPDVVHLHNIHGYYVNIEMLFDWLVAHECQVKWTLHDCWSFTGHCAYFTYAGCNQWMMGCAKTGDCQQLDTYPKTFSRQSCARNYEDKKRIFTGIPVERMTLVTPSHWLEGLVKQSFLMAYPAEVHHNVVDRTVFKPTPGDFRERCGIGDRFMILGVASPWTERKGLDSFVRLVTELDFEKYAIVIVGLSDRQVRKLPDKIVRLTRTESSKELAAIYTAADAFFNPTVEDNYPTVNLEAEACGTPVVTYDTGGCRETIHFARSKVVDGFDDAVTALKELAAESRQGESNAR